MCSFWGAKGKKKSRNRGGSKRERSCWKGKCKTKDLNRERQKHSGGRRKVRKRRSNMEGCEAPSSGKWLEFGSERDTSDKEGTKIHRSLLDRMRRYEGTMFGFIRSDIQGRQKKTVKVEGRLEGANGTKVSVGTITTHQKKIGGKIEREAGGGGGEKKERQRRERYRGCKRGREKKLLSLRAENETIRTRSS